MTEVKIALSIEEAADYTGIGRNTLPSLAVMNFSSISVLIRTFRPTFKIGRAHV